MEEHDLMTATEAAALIGVSRATIWRRYRAGRLPAANAHELNSARDKQIALRFHRADVLALAAPHLDAAPPRLLAEPPPGYDPHA
jgi:hypothetical protein